MIIARTFARPRFSAAHSFRFVGALLSVTLFVAFVCPPARAQKQPERRAPETRKLPSPEKIVADYLKAIGGKKRAAGIRDSTYEWVVQGRADRGSPAEGRARTITKAPFSARTDIILTSGEINVAANARAAWTRALDGRLRTLTDAEAGAVKLQAALGASRLVDFKKLNVLARTVALDQGDERAGSSSERAYIVEVSKRDGARLRYWFGASSKLLLKVSDEARSMTTRFSQYRTVNNNSNGGALEPHRVEIERPPADAFVLTLSDVRYNTGPGDALFDPPSETSLDIPALLREVGRNQSAVDDRVSDYTYTRRQVEREINDRGEVKKEKVLVHEIYPVPGGGRVLKLISENGRVLVPEQMAKEEKRVAEELEKAARANEKRKQKREQEEAARAKKTGGETGMGESGDDDLGGISAFLKACEFVAPRRERFRDREAIVFDFRARPGFRPSNRSESIIAKLAGIMWIDPVDKQVIRLEARLDQSFKIGGGLLASVRPGSTFAFEQTRLADGVWLPRFAQINASAKVFLFAGFRLDATREYSDYKRFTTRAGEATLDAPKSGPDER